MTLRLCFLTLVRLRIPPTAQWRSPAQGLRQCPECGTEGVHAESAAAPLQGLSAIVVRPCWTFTISLRSSLTLTKVTGKKPSWTNHYVKQDCGKAGPCWMHILPYNPATASASKDHVDECIGLHVRC